MMLLLVVVAVCLYGLYLYSVWTYGYWKARGVPSPQPVPLFGNIKDVVLLRQFPGHCYQDIYRSYAGERLVGVYQLRRPCLLLRDPALVKQCLVKDFDHWTDRGFHTDEAREPLTAHLVNLTGARWRLLRAKLTPAFSSGKIKAMFPLLETCSHQLNHFVQSQIGGKSGVIEMREVTARFTTDVIGTIAFGLQFDSMSGDSVFRQMGKKALEPSCLGATAKALRAFLPWLFDLLRLRTFPEEINTFFTGVVRDTMVHRQTHKVVRNDFLQLMIQLKQTDIQTSTLHSTPNDNIVFTDAVIAAQAFVFFLAGFETSSTTLSYCLHELAWHPDCQTKAHEEIRQTLNKHGALTYDAVMKMTYLEQLLLETMRLYPPVSWLSRVCTKQYRVPGTEVTIQPGVGLVVPVFAIHRDPAYFPSPDLFIPDRFHDIDLSSSTYLPFGYGPRICIGQRFALLEMKLALIQLLQNYEVAPSSRSVPVLDVDPKSFIMAPKDGVWLQLTSR